MSTPRIVGFGASSVRGASDPEGGFLARLQVLAPELEVVNKGIGGNSTQHMLARAGELEELRPYDLIVMLGCNDLPRTPESYAENRNDLAAYTRNLEELLPRIKSRGGRNLFISSFPVCRERVGIEPALFAEYMGAALGVARAQGFEIWDLYAEILASGRDYLSADGLHYGAEGHAMLAERLLPWARQSGAA